MDPVSRRIVLTSSAACTLREPAAGERRSAQVSGLAVGEDHTLTARKPDKLAFYHQTARMMCCRA